MGVFRVRFSHASYEKRSFVDKRERVQILAQKKAGLPTGSGLPEVSTADLFVREITMAQVHDIPTSIARNRPASLWAASVVDAILRAADGLARYHRRAQERRALYRMDDYMLHDIGISRADVELEASKPFWRP
jgi:uncharacterized protein YjiS (DUF1127 family)